MTLDQYGDVFPDDLEEVAEKMDDPVAGCARNVPTKETGQGLVALDLHLYCGAAGNRTRVLRHFLEASPCGVRYASTRIS